MAPIKVCVAGVSGRMGQMLIAAALDDPAITLSGAFGRADGVLIGRDAGDLLGRKTGVIVTSDAKAAISASDILIDFTRPVATLEYAALCANLGKKMVVGTTGFDAAQTALLQAHAQRTGIVFAPNMSVAVNVLFKLTRLATELMNEGFDIEIVEAHHNKKVDAPSGTALGLGRAVASGLQQPLEDIAVYERYGDIGPRKAGTVGFSTIRAGDIIGDHTVIFAGAGERIELTHRSQSRSTYAAGSMRAAKFIAGKAAGFFDMQDVLGIK
jgi:4-hydroxy-tetrahydrodipicolinate reductase